MNNFKNYFKELFQRYFIETVKNKYIDFSNRADRKEFWYFMLFNTMIILALTLLGHSYLLIFKTEPRHLLYLFYAMMIFPALLSVVVRRLHDTDRSGWWYLLIFVPAMLIAVDEFEIMHIPYLFIMILMVIHYLGFFLLLYFLIQKSQEETNRYGPKPNLDDAPSNKNKDGEALKSFLEIMSEDNKKE